VHGLQIMVLMEAMSSLLATLHGNGSVHRDMCAHL
jgi:hypothetical protein